VTSDLTFNAGTSTQTVEIFTTGDTVLEMSESFTVSLSQTSVDAAVTLDPPSATIEVYDDDSKLMNDFSMHCLSPLHNLLLFFSCYNRVQWHNLQCHWRWQC